jgi:hypothetical protein
MGLPEFTEKELRAIKYMIDYLAREGCHGEDTIGAILYTGAFRLLDDGPSAVTDLAKKLDAIKVGAEDRLSAGGDNGEPA